MKAERRRTLVSFAVLLLALAFAPWSWLSGATHAASQKLQPKQAEGVAKDVAPPPPPVEGGCPLGFTSAHAHLLPMGHPPVA